MITSIVALMTAIVGLLREKGLRDAAKATAKDLQSKLLDVEWAANAPQKPPEEQQRIAREQGEALRRGFEPIQGL